MPVSVVWKWKADEYPPPTGSSISRSSPQEAFDEQGYLLPLNRVECDTFCWESCIYDYRPGTPRVLRSVWDGRSRPDHDRSGHWAPPRLWLCRDAECERGQRSDDGAQWAVARGTTAHGQRSPPPRGAGWPTPRATTPAVVRRTTPSQPRYTRGSRSCRAKRKPLVGRETAREELCPYSTSCQHGGARRLPSPCKHSPGHPTWHERLRLICIDLYAPLRRGAAALWGAPAGGAGRSSVVEASRHAQP